MTARLRSSWGSRAGLALVGAVASFALLAPVLAPQAPSDQLADRAYAPPTRIHLFDAQGLRAPFIYAQVVEDRLARRYRDDESRPVRVQWLTGGRLMSVADGESPLLILGADALGRDIFARLAYGTRISMSVTALGVIGALLIGSVLGAIAGTAGGWIDSVLMQFADFVLVLPGAYLVLFLRALLPQSLTTAQTFGLMTLLFAAAAWPHVARGVRAVVASERARDYAEAARAAGAGRIRLALTLAPAARGFLLVEIGVLIPALLVAEVTLSYLGLGFQAPAASWGAMLHDAENVQIMQDAPWTLAPAVALFLVVLGVQLAGSARSVSGVLTGASTGR